MLVAAGGVAALSLSLLSWCLLLLLLLLLWLRLLLFLLLLWLFSLLLLLLLLLLWVLLLVQFFCCGCCCCSCCSCSCDLVIVLVLEILFLRVRVADNCNIHTNLSAETLLVFHEQVVFSFFNQWLSLLLGPGPFPLCETAPRCRIRTNARRRWRRQLAFALRGLVAQCFEHRLRRFLLVGLHLYRCRTFYKKVGQVKMTVLDRKEKRCLPRVVSIIHLEAQIEQQFRDD